jgi:hypothetical protein
VNKTDDFAHNKIISAVKVFEFVSDKISYIIQRGLWFNNIVLYDQIKTKGKDFV